MSALEIIDEHEDQYRKRSRGRTEDGKQEVMKEVRANLLVALQKADYACRCGQLIAWGAQACHR